MPFPPPRDLPDPGTERVSLVPCTGRQGLFHCAPVGLSHAFPLLALAPLVSLSHSAFGSFPLFIGDFTAENALTLHVEVLSKVPKSKKTVTCLKKQRKHVC